MFYLFKHTIIITDISVLAGKLFGNCVNDIKVKL